MAHIPPSDTAVREDSTALEIPIDAAGQTGGFDPETLAAFDQILDDQLRVSWMQDRQRWQA